MKKSSILIIMGLFLFIAAGCSNTDEQVSGNLTPAPGKLSVSDLNEILANLELVLCQEKVQIKYNQFSLFM